MTTGIQNCGFADGDITKGSAESWDASTIHGTSYFAQRIATFLGSTLTYEAFEAGWGRNQDAVLWFTDALLIVAPMQGGGSDVDGFEAGWLNVELAMTRLADADTVLGIEDPMDWFNASSSTTGYMTGPSGGTATQLNGDFDTTNVSYEDFEEQWQSVENSASAYTDSPTPGAATKTTGMFDSGATAYEGFEVGTSAWYTQLQI